MFLFQPVSFNQMVSLKDNILDRDKDKVLEQKLLQFSTTNMIRVYPHFFVDTAMSQNYNPIPHWAYGSQMVALNFQTNDKQMHLNRAMFRLNGSCGWVLKPEYLRSPRSTTTTMISKYTIRVLCACLWDIDEYLDYPIDLSVSLSFHDLNKDIQQSKIFNTKSVHNSSMVKSSRLYLLN